MVYKNPVPNIDFDRFGEIEDVEIGTCAYCKTENVPVTSTSETDTRCIECMRLTRDNCNEAIRKLKDFPKVKDYIHEKMNNKSLTDLKKHYLDYQGNIFL